MGQSVPVDDDNGNNSLQKTFFRSINPGW
jgi:hypothetical protein